MSEYDEIYNGPRYHETLKGDSLGGIASDTDSAFALGRELYKTGRKLPTSSKRPKAWTDALRKGYAWQKKRSKLSGGAR